MNVDLAMGMGMQTYIVGSETYPVGIRACRPTQWGSGHADYTVGMGTQTYPSGEGRVDIPRGGGGGNVVLVFFCIKGFC